MNKRKLALIFVITLTVILTSQTPIGEVEVTVENRVIDTSPSFMLSAGENWLTGWMYRQNHTMIGATGAGTNHQIELFVEYGSGSSSDNVVYCESHSQTNFGDIRFTDDDGSTLLDYWMEEYTASDDATFWIEVIDDLGSNQIIYIYYGTSGTSTTASDGDATFIAFDDFEDNNLDKWEGENPTYVYTQSGTVYAGTYAAYFNPSSVSMGMYYNFTEQVGTLDYGVMLNYHVRTSTTAKVWYDRMAGSGGTGYDMVLGGVTSYVSYYTTVYAKYPNNIQFSSNTWLEINHAIVPSGSSTQRVWESEDYCGSINYGPVTNNPDLKWVTYACQKNLDAWMDNFYVRKWIPIVPSHSIWGDEESNSAPVNSATPVCTNLDDGDNLYAHYKTYIFTSNVTDANGYDDIDYVYLESYDYDTTTLRWTIKYTQYTNAFEETNDASGYIELVTGSCLYSKGGNGIDITWYIEIDWLASPYVLTDDDLYQIVYDYSGNGDTDEYESNYDYVAQLDLDWWSLTDGSGTVTRGNINGIDTITTSGGIIYDGSVNNYPASDQVDAWISCGDVAGSPWSDLTLNNGQFSMTVDSDDVVGLDTYAYKVVLEGVSSGGTNQLHAAHSLTYIADRVQVQSYSVADARVNINDNVNIDVTLDYEYGGDVTDGTVTINGFSASHQGSGVWRITRTSASVTSVTYNTVAVSGNVHGITVEDQNGQSQQVIWDRIYLSSTGLAADDYREFYLSPISVTAWVYYEFDDAPVTTGKVYLNGAYESTHGVDEQWSYVFDFNTIRDLNITSITTDGLDTYGITAINNNNKFAYVIWDQIKVIGYSCDDTRINYGATSSCTITLYYAFDDSYVTTGDHVYLRSGTVEVLYSGANGVWNFNETISAVVGYTYNDINVQDDEYALNGVEDQNGQSLEVIWDRIKILTTSASLNYIDKGIESTIISVTAELEYDNHALGASDTLYMNNTEMTWNTDHYEITFGPYDVFGSWSLYVNSSSANEATYGITIINLNGQSTTIATDRIIVISYSVSDARDNINDYIWTNVTVQYESDNADVTDGTIVINGYSFTHIGSGVWRHNRTQASAVGITFNDLVASGNTRGILLENQNGQSQQVIWDEIEVYWSTVFDGRDDIGDQNYPCFRLRLKYDNHLLNDGTNDVVNINSSAASWYVGDAYWYKFYTMDSVGSWNFVVTSASENTYGITAFDSASATTYDIDIIWEAIGISMWIDDGRDNIDDTITVYAWLTYMYDATNVTDGTVLLNGTGMSYSSQIWSLGRSQSTVGLWAYNITSISGNTFGITTIGNVYFDSSNDWIDCGDLGNPAAGTIALWFLKYDTGVRYLLDGRGTGNWWLITHFSGNDVDFTGLVFWNGMVLNTWYHVVVTADASETKLYINGVLEDTGSALSIDFRSVRIAVRYAPPWGFFSGQMRDFRIYGRVIDAVEAYELYQGHYSDNTDLLLYYPTTSFDVEDNTWYDMSGNNNDGTVYRATANQTYSNVYTRPIWDRVNVDMAVNMTWQVIGYYTNISYTGTYESDSTSWTGYAIVANTSLTTGGAVHYEELTFLTVTNTTFYTTTIEDAGGYGITVFTTNTVWCIFDDVIAGSEGDMYWHKEVGYSRLIWGEVSTWKWQFNGSWIDNTYTLHAYSNSSTPEATGGIYSSGNFGGFVVGPYDVSWYYVNLTVNCEVTINGNAYDWEIWNLLMAVDIVHTIYIENFEIEPTDYYFWVAYQSNWNNATIMIWDALVNAGTSSADTILNGTLQTEGMYHWSRSAIVGTHNVSILINGSASALDEQNKDFSLDDAWWWYNFTYVIVAEDIEITTYTFFGATSDFDYMQYSGYINYDCTYNISEWSASWAKNETHTGSVSEGMFNIAWNKIGVNDVDANFTIVFVNGSLSLTINGFYGTAYKILRIDEIDVDNTEESQALTNITVNFYTNKDVDYYVYDRDDDDAVLVSGSSVEGSDYITWAKNVIPHAHYYAVKWTDGVTNIWYNASYWTFEENIDSLPKPQIDWDARDARRTLEFWNIVGLIVGVVSVFAIAYTYYNFDKRFKGLELPHYDTQQDDDDR